MNTQFEILKRKLKLAAHGCGPITLTGEEASLIFNELLTKDNALIAVEELMCEEDPLEQNANLTRAYTFAHAARNFCADHTGWLHELKEFCSRHKITGDVNGLTLEQRYPVLNRLLHWQEQL